MRPLQIRRLSSALMRNLNVRTKLAAVVAGPTVLAVVLAGTSAASDIGAAVNYRDTDNLAQLGRAVTTLVVALENERDITSRYIASGRVDTPDRAAAQRTVDAAITAYQQAVTTTGAADYSIAHDHLAAVDADLNGLGFARNATQVASLTRPSVLASYTSTIDKLLTLATGVVDANADRRLVDEMHALADFLQAQDIASQIRAELAAAAAAGRFAVGQAEALDTLRVREQSALDAFRSEASDAQRTVLADVFEGPAVTAFEVQIDRALAQQTSDHLDVDPTAWFRTASDTLGLLHTVQTRLLDDVAGDISTLRSQATLAAVELAALLVAAIVIAVGAATLGARSMTKPLSELRKALLDVVHRQLPAVTQQLAQGKGDAIVDLRIPTLSQPDARDEFGVLGRAFITFAAGFMGLANTQATIDGHVRATVVNLALRSQSLVERLIKHLDVIERDANPELLDQLFQIDVCSTLLRRMYNTLKVLGGARLDSRGQRDLLIDDVLGAAISQVENYQRIIRGPVVEVGLRGPAVPDVVHLLAELLANATYFSEPSKPVEIRCFHSGLDVDGLEIWIYDHGAGMAPALIDKTNAQLRSPSPLAESIGQRLGLRAVATLAAYHDIDVDLTSNSYGGITATVRLPWALLTPPPAARVPEEAALPSSTAGHAAAEVGQDPFAIVPRADPVAAGPAITRAPDRSRAAGGRSGHHVELPVRNTDDRHVGFPQPSRGDGTYTAQEIILMRRRVREEIPSYTAIDPDPQVTVDLHVPREWPPTGT